MSLCLGLFLVVVVVVVSCRGCRQLSPLTRTLCTVDSRYIDPCEKGDAGQVHLGTHTRGLRLARAENETPGCGTKGSVLGEQRMAFSNLRHLSVTILLMSLSTLQQVPQIAPGGSYNGTQALAGRLVFGLDPVESCILWLDGLSRLSSTLGNNP